MRLKLKTKRTVVLGTFELTSPALVVADPGYQMEGVRAQGLGAFLTNCQTGTWHAQVVIKEFDQLQFPVTAELQAWHTNVASPTALKWRKQKGSIGVDSATAGVFDAAHFHDHRLVPADTKWTHPPDRKDLWYSYCCEMVGWDANRAAGSVIPHGVVTSSGGNDGDYAYFVARDESGRIIGIWVLFADDSGKG